MRRLPHHLLIALLAFIVGFGLWAAVETYNSSVITHQRSKRLEAEAVRRQPTREPTPLDLIDDYYRGRCWAPHPTKRTGNALPHVMKSGSTFEPSFQSQSAMLLSLIDPRCL